MAAGSIRLFGDGVLRRRAREADPAAPATRALLDRMWEVLAADGGVGLAAPQVGVLARVVVIRDPERRGRAQRIDLVNPEIRATFGPAKPFEEGCLSFPGLYTTVLRPQGVELAYRTPDAPDDEQVLRDEGLVARIAQHEVDHLDGVLFIDHLQALDRWLLAPRLAGIMLRQAAARLRRNRGGRR